MCAIGHRRVADEPSYDDDLDAVALERTALFAGNTAVGDQDVDVLYGCRLTQRGTPDLAVVDGDDDALGRAQQGTVGGGDRQIGRGETVGNGQSVAPEKELVHVQA